MLTAIGTKDGWIARAAALMCLLLVGSAVGVAASAPAYVSVTSATVSDDDPETGDRIIVTPTITHSGSGSGSFAVSEVTLVDETGERHAEAGNVGTLGAGDTVEIPLSASFATAGDRRLTIHVRGRQYDADGRLVRSVHLTHPAYVSVSEPSESTETPPQLHVETGRAVAGTDTTVAVTVSNGGDDKLTDLSVRLESVDGTMTSRTAIEPVLAAENATTVRFTVRPLEPGERTLKATLRHADGTVEAFDVVDVEPLRDEVSIHATVVEQNESFYLQYRVTNRGNAPIEDVTLSGETANASLPAASVQTVEPATSRTTTIELGSRPTGAATVTATYDVGDATGRAHQSVRLGVGSPTDADADEGADVTRASLDGASLFGPSTFLTGILVGGVAVTGAILGYRGWTTRRED